MHYVNFIKPIRKHEKQGENNFTYLEKKPTVAIVFPVFNPSNDWWALSFLHCTQLVQKAPQYYWQFHFVNDGSREHVFPSFNALDTEGCHPSIFFHSYPENQGKGYAIRYGLQQVGDEADFFIHSDWDFPFGTDLLLDAVKQLEYSDVVVADRGQAYLTNLPPFRQKLTKTQRFFNRYVLRLKTRDTQAGFKAFNEKGKHLFLKTKINGFLFDTEFIRLSERNQLSINTLDANCRQNLQFKNFSYKVLKKEVLSLVYLLLR